MSNDTNPSEKKLYVDEDWKSQVEAEKAAAAGTNRRPSRTSEKRPAEPLPPPTLTFLASTLYLQGAISMGLLPNPISDKSELRLDRAKHAIDMLAMLQEKTEGNRTPEESDETRRHAAPIANGFCFDEERIVILVQASRLPRICGRLACPYAGETPVPQSSHKTSLAASLAGTRLNLSSIVLSFSFPSREGGNEAQLR